MTSRMLSRLGQNRLETIETESQTAVRRCAMFEGVHKEPNLYRALIFRQTEQTEHVILQLRVMYAYRSSAKFVSVDYHVARLWHGQHRYRCRACPHPPVRRSERMMHGTSSAAFHHPIRKRGKSTTHRHENLRITHARDPSPSQTQFVELLAGFIVAPASISIRSPGFAPPRSSQPRSSSSE